MSKYAEELYEELDGDLCICQRPDVPHWCEKCQSRIELIDDAFRRHVERQAVPAVATTVEEGKADPSRKKGERKAGNWKQVGS